MTSAYYYNQQQQAGGIPPPVPQQQRGIPGQININPAQGHYIQQQQQQQQQQQYRNQGMSDPNAHRKRAHSSKASRQAPPMTDDADEPSGDELDDISARDIAMARYKRNHDYLSEIFTPYNAASIVPPPLDINQTKEELDKQIEEHKERTVRQKTSHEEKIAILEKEQEKFWQLMNQLNQANTLESIDDASENLAKEMGVKIEHTAKNVKILSIPGLKDEDLIEQEERLKLQKEREEQLRLQQEAQANAVSSAATATTTTEEEQNKSQSPLDQQQAQREEDTNMDMFFDDNQTAEAGEGIEQEEGEKQGEEEETATDSFFNEMVDTGDDDPSVNEFLNTE